MSELYGAIKIAASGMHAQNARVRVIAENMANANTAPMKPGQNPYTRKTITFKNEMDKADGIDLVKVAKVGEDTKHPYILKYMPEHPAADANGYVKMPNIDPLVEMMDMREAQRTYEANLGMLDQSRNMMLQTIDLLKR